MFRVVWLQYALAEWFLMVVFNDLLLYSHSRLRHLFLPRSSICIPHASQAAQNGRGERLHCALMAKGQAHAIGVIFPPTIGMNLSYLSNRTPVASQSGHAPFECWFSRVPNFSHLHEIGCRIFILIQSRHNPKIADPSLLPPCDEQLEGVCVVPCILY
jgi:hypothetical protein